MATLRGSGIIFGTGVTASAGIIISATTGFVQSEDFSRQAEKTEVKDGIGDVRTVAYSNLTKSMTVVVVPADTATPTTADAVVNADAMLVAPGTIVTIADANSTVTDGTHTAKYLLDGCRRRTTNTGEAVVEADLMQYDANDVAVAVS